MTTPTTPLPRPPKPKPTSAPARRSRPVRAVLIAIGLVSLGIGLLGIVVPVLPTTPFLLLAAACFARASDRLYAWLLGHATLGPIISQWRETQSMARAVKVRALVLVAVTFTASILLVEPLAVRAALALTGVIVLLFLARIPVGATEG